MARTIYKVGIVFEFDPEGEHEDLFEGMTKEDIEREMRRLVIQDISSGYGSVEIVSTEEVED